MRILITLAVAFAAAFTFALAAPPRVSACTGCGVTPAALAARDPVALFEQARAHVARQEWSKATACYAEGFKLEPTDDAELWFEYAATPSTCRIDSLRAGGGAAPRPSCGMQRVRSCSGCFPQRSDDGLRRR